MNTPNWMKNSGKPKKGRGIAKGRLKSRRQTLQAVKAKYMDSSRSGTQGRHASPRVCCSCSPSAKRCGHKQSPGGSVHPTDHGTPGVRVSRRATPTVGAERNRERTRSQAERPRKEATIQAKEDGRRCRRLSPNRRRCRRAHTASTSSTCAEASASILGHRPINSKKYGMTVLTTLCWSMITDNQT